MILKNLWSIDGFLKEEKRFMDFDYLEKYVVFRGLVEIKGCC